MIRHVSRSKAALGAAFLATALCLPVAAPVFAADPAPLAFPGAQGWAAHATGGRGGRIIRVTTLAPEGPGSIG